MTEPVLDGPKNQIGDGVSKDDARINFDRLLRECSWGNALKGTPMRSQGN